jgi:fructan beta-fructosidase
MLVSLWAAGPNGGTATRYFVGDFDGRSFTNSSPPQTVNWLDYGCDNYATITFSDVPNDRRLGIGWMSNWLYAGAIPTFPWRSAMTLPRELSLTAVPHNPPQLISQPIKELESLRGQPFVIADHLIKGTVTFPDIKVDGCFEILLDCDLDTASEFSLSLKNEQGEETLVGYDRECCRLFIDRQRSGHTDFSPDFASQRHTAKWLPQENKLRLHLFVDWSSVELFVDNGRLVMTEQLFPTTPYNQLTFYANSGNVHLTRCQIWQLDSIW